MKFKISYKITCFAVLILALLTGTESSAQTDNYYVVANASVPVTDMTKDELVSNLMGKKTRWSDKSKIVLGLMDSDTGTGKKIAEDILGLTTSQMNKYYLTMVFQGKMSPPKFFSSEADLINFLSSTNGAIGITSKPIREGVKTISISD
ncbi:MAG: hypothetical protein GY816_21450 [Cytophagales bacterium]|nr:hypothetical protein [Cytophagales bacterium]